MDNTSVMVSICCLTYNHAPYIRECLDGFLMQQVDFPIEIIIHDDASTDGTQDILREYQEKYPDLFHLILQTENQYSKGKNVVLDYIYPQIKGKYVASCEGDDYWIDPHKLQKQVGFLEAHPDYSVCCHCIKLYIQNEGVFREQEMQPRLRNKSFSFTLQLWTEFGGFFQTASVVIRQECIDIKFLNSFQKCKDIHLFYSVLEHGKGYFFKDVMSVYRISGKGVWTSLPFKERVLIGVETSYEIYQKRKNEFTKKWLAGYLGELVLFCIRKDKSLKKTLKTLPMIVDYCGYKGIGYVCQYISKKLMNRYVLK
ncbi:glycosyltransferase [uncultured Phocaeicola sp.]|uniref:glycosyltransferase family 2 protein n=1 Tax=uncultured Phocaeicola sp. TaxID=990718 RepID=UPI0025E36EF8|nr:glycosyltransferase [uncultured Phocaeicola sp.]